jgi:hypothetical protein
MRKPVSKKTSQNNVNKTLLVSRKNTLGKLLVFDIL